MGRGGGRAGGAHLERALRARLAGESPPGGLKVGVVGESPPRGRIACCGMRARLLLHPARELRCVAQPAAADAERSKMSAAHGKDVARRARSSARAPCARIARHLKHVAA